VASPEEIAEYLASLATGLKQGQLSLESGEHVLRLVPAPELKLELRVTRTDRKGRIEIEIGWKRPLPARAADLRVDAGPLPTLRV
jgi:amphi-Trp domain-containing protein